MFNEATMVIKAIVPAFFSASIWTVSSLINPPEDIVEGNAIDRDFWYAYAVSSFLFITLGQTITNYKYQKAADADMLQQRCGSRYVSYIMAALKSVNGGLALLHALSSFNAVSNSSINTNVYLRLGLAAVLGIPQYYGQLASVMVKPDNPAQRVLWTRITNCISPAWFILIGNGFGSYLYDSSFFHSMQELLGEKQKGLDYFTLANQGSLTLEEFRGTALYSLTNIIFLSAVATSGLAVWLIVNQGWMEKWNKFRQPVAAHEGEYLHIEDPENINVQPLHLPFQGLHTKVAYKPGLDNEGRRIEREKVRNYVTHFKGLTGGLSGAALLSKVIKHWPMLGDDVVSLRVIVLPLVVLMGHDELSWMHNFVNTMQHKKKIWTASGAAWNLFSCKPCRNGPENDPDGLALFINPDADPIPNPAAPLSPFGYGSPIG